jgi:hypothetical protein
VTYLVQPFTAVTLGDTCNYIRSNYICSFCNGTEGSKSWCAQHLHDVRGLHDAHLPRQRDVTFGPLCMWISLFRSFVRLFFDSDLLCASLTFFIHVDYFQDITSRPHAFSDAAANMFELTTHGYNMDQLPVMR